MSPASAFVLLLQDSSPPSAAAAGQPSLPLAAPTRPRLPTCFCEQVLGTATTTMRRERQPPRGQVGPAELVPAVLPRARGEG